MTQQNENSLMTKNGETDSWLKRTMDDPFPRNLIHQVCNALPFHSYPDVADQKRMRDAGILVLNEMDPKDPMEGMLMTQMVATHNSIMECYRLSVHENLSIEQRINYVNNANKLVRSYVLLQDSLQRYRGKASHEQKIIVQHIQVSEGGQAIVGDINKD